MNKTDEVLKLAKECGATTYTNRHYPDATAVTFSPLAWEKFCEQALAAPVQVLQRYSPDGEGGMEVDSLGVYVKHQDVSNPPAAPVQKRPQNCGTGYCSCIECVMEPAPVQVDAWPCVIAEADFEQDTITLKMQCSDYEVRAGQHWLHTTKPTAQPAQLAVPDAITDIGENPDYRAGWNECRETMLQILKARTL
jgi:hypothetical protein